MDKSSYAMAKLGLDAKSSLAPKRDCSFYMKYFFLFASLIQFLIILGLVLFMIYGNAHSGTATHVQHLERRVQEQFARATELSATNRNLTLQLNATAKQRQTCLGSLAGLRAELTKCNASLLSCATIKLQLQATMGAIDYFQGLATRCHQALEIANVTCYAEKLALRDLLAQQALQLHSQRENCSRDMAQLQDKARAAQEMNGICQKEKQSLRLEHSEMRGQLGQVRGRCGRLEQEVRDAVSGVQQALKEATGYGMRPTQACDQVSVQLQQVLGAVEQDLRAMRSENRQLGSDRDRCGESLNQCTRLQDTEREKARQELQQIQAQRKTEEQQRLEERKQLLQEKESLNQQLQESRKQLAQSKDLRTQLDNCLRFKPATPPQRNPNPFGSVGSLGNPGVFGNPATSFRSAGAVPTFGNMPNLAFLDEIRRKMMEEAKLSNQLPKNPPAVGQPSG
ncbi:PREDICTED: plasmalemma vesicle-associated protein [Crocodylus porosus]|uniref:Plasmalemma vesicle associated protein n=1 Tax=Crocodylus porosus TaxID=8502 RepID=A0A7M4DWZ1_CROPO|nr:PREDICTED: plasmalemma vesicle-associated protein [Crocodylus porosus]